MNRTQAVVALVASIINMLIWLVAVLFPSQFSEPMAELAESGVGVVWAIANLGFVGFAIIQLRPRAESPSSRQVITTDQHIRAEGGGTAPQVLAQGDARNISGNTVTVAASNFVAVLAVAGLTIALLVSLFRPFPSTGPAPSSMPLPTNTAPSSPTDVYLPTTSTTDPAPAVTVTLALDISTDVEVSPTPLPPQPTTPMPPTSIPTKPAPSLPQPTTPAPPPPRPTTPVPPSSSLTGRIIVPVFDGATYNLYVARASSGWQKRLLIGNASQPAYSPDGAYLAYRDWRSDHRGLWAARADGSEARRITSDNAWEDAVPRWRFSDRQLVYCRRGTGILPELYQVWGLGGGPVARIWAAGTGIYGEAPAWLPGGAIVFQRWKESSDRLGLWIVTERGEILRQLTSDASDTAPAVAKSGKIAFMRQAGDGQWDVYQVNGDGSGVVNLSQHGANDGLPTWSPDGRHVAFVSDRGDKWAVWAVPVGGGQAQKLFDIGQLHGIPASDTTHSTRGWVDESLSWVEE